MTLRDFLFAISVPFLWGIGFVITKPGMEQFPPMLINGLRWSLSGLILVWFFPIPKKYLKSIFVVSIVACTIQYSLTFSGLNIIDASSAVLFVQCEVPFGVLIAFFLLKERPKFKNILGIILAFIGLMILAGSPDLKGKYLGVILVLSGAFTWSLGQVLVKPISEKINGVALTAWMGVFAGPQLILASQIIERNVLENIISADYRAWLIVLYLGILMNCLGYSLWYYVLGRYPINKVISTMLLLPVTGVITAILFLGERPDTKVFIGGLIILFGVGMILFEKKIKEKN
ncbi:EamA family transporter [Alphaproteobacteria bacterium]|nr:EamA family transporter [Alphaproteobacteria bacterium]